MKIEYILSLLDGVKPRGDNQWQALCPVHNDKVPSLSVSLGKDSTVLMKCQAGCSFKKICDALGIDMADCFPNKSKGKSNSDKIVATYDYRDESGKLLFQVCRTADKEFPTRRPNGSWGIKGVRRVLYRLPELLTANNEQVFVAEGERDVDRLAKLGLVATTNVGGAGKWRAEYNQFLKGRRVAILPDNDPVGINHAEDVATALIGVAAEVKIIKLDDLPPGGDVSDWLNAGNDKITLGELIEKTGQFEPTTQTNDAGAGAQTKPASEFNLTDAGNGERFAAQHKQNIRYLWSRNKWVVYDGIRWDIEAGTEVARAGAVQTARSILREAEGKSYEERGPYLKWSYQSESHTRLKNMLEEAKVVRPLPAYAKDFDCNVMSFNVRNITVALGDRNNADPRT